jgi:CheY-like chemotaxis protein
MRRRPRTSHPVSYFEEFVTLDLDEQMEAAPRGPALRVLLLEDRDDFREVLHDYLVFHSHEVTSVRSGVEGLREIMKGAFDIILCDMMMPQVGGEMFYWAVTRVRPANAQRFIFFTGHQNNPAINFFFRRVNATVLMKPFKLAELDAAIRDVLLKLG